MSVRQRLILTGSEACVQQKQSNFKPETGCLWVVVVIVVDSVACLWNKEYFYCTLHRKLGNLLLLVQ